MFSGFGIARCPITNNVVVSVTPVTQPEGTREAYIVSLSINFSSYVLLGLHRYARSSSEG